MKTLPVLLALLLALPLAGRADDKKKKRPPQANFGQPQQQANPNAAALAQQMVKIYIANLSGMAVNATRFLPDGSSNPMGTLAPSGPDDGPAVMNSRPGMRWVFTAPNGQVVGRYTVTNAPNQRYVIGAAGAQNNQPAVINQPIVVPPQPQPIRPPNNNNPGIVPGGGMPAAAQAFMQVHNTARAQVGVPPLQWSSELAAFAQEWANHLASLPKSRVMQSPHRPNDGTGPGENFGGGTGAYGPADAARSWLSERNGYNYGPITGVDGTGHYTQMVWRDTTHVGYGMARSADGWTYVIANYGPAGNVLGQAPY